MCCLLSDCGRPGSTVFKLIKVNVIQLKFRDRSLVGRLTFLCILLNCLMFDFLLPAELFDV